MNKEEWKQVIDKVKLVQAEVQSIPLTYIGMEEDWYKIQHAFSNYRLTLQRMMEKDLCDLKM